MKTNTNFSNLKKTSLTVLSALVLTSGSIFANRPASFMENLDAFMNNQEKMILYTPNDLMENTEVDLALERLDVLVSTSESSIIYKAPATDETSAAADAIERLDNLVASTEESLKYQAPTTDRTSEVYAETERMDKLIAATETALRYRAPVTPELQIFDNVTDCETENMLCDLNK
jgi:hypothetical protein